MPKLQLDVPHSLGAQEARSRLQRFADMLRGEHKDKVSDLEQGWQGDTLKFAFKTFGIKIAGAIDVREDALHVAGDLPFSAMMFKGKIESEIRHQLERLVRV